MMWDEKANGRSKKSQKGFTLVELIVVLVILGILIAIMVPVLTGWIRKAKNQDAILECRSVVMAAQGQAAEEYAKNPNGSMNDIMNEEGTVEAIMKTAATDGKISNPIELDESVTVTGLKYTTAKGIVVIYDRAHQPVYRIESDADRKLNSAPSYKDKLEELMKKDGLLGEEGTVTDKLKPTGKDNTIGQALQQYFFEKLGDKFPVLTEAEKEELKDKLKKATDGTSHKLSDEAWNGFQTKLDEAVWKPIVTAEGKTMMVADVGNNKDKKGAALACIIYYDNNYYVKMNPGGNSVNTIWISDQGSARDDGFKSEWLNDSIVKDGWSKI
ncbi:MAG: prepilin-type N-terminal cleavage/methylation domain-containing protein [Lachnospiraceae bacterium]|nr:prepilin-type N-terminal cleavage/methylation domain-containing protein [Lachnospiraceae bacterium]